MAEDITDNAFAAVPSSDVYTEAEAALNDAYAQAVAEYNQLMEQIAPKQGNKSPFDHFEMYEAPGIGNYVIMKKPGWRELADLIGYDYIRHRDHDSIKAKSTIFANIDFSANVYPAFDGIIGDHFQSPYLLNPLDDKYESFKDLRDNLAAVRNFLLQTYFDTTPEGMTSEKARAYLEEIAAFVGDGLHNNWLYLGLIPNHHPAKPFIDIERAREGNGKGAQYIYEKILEHQRHSSWLKPFNKLTELFGGKVQHDWHLPSADKTHFRDVVFKSVGAVTPEDAALAAARNRIAEIEARLGSIRDARALSTASADLDAIGNHLLYTAEHHENDVAHLSEPVRLNAVEIARDILRKLKFSLGAQSTLDGLNMKPSDDMAALGAINGVATVYARLLAWARSNHDSDIFRHPAILAATRALGQLGVLAKLEGLRMAELAGNPVLIERIREQLLHVPESYRPTAGTRFGDLFDALDSGINTIINRTQEVGVAGAKVGFSRENTLGQTLSSAPTAGIANQVNVNQAVERNAQAAQADQLAAMAQAQRIQAQLAAQARTQPSQQQAAPPPPPVARGASVGRSALRQAQQQRATASTTNTTSSATPQVNLSPAQQMQAQRSATAAAAAQAAREREEQLRTEQQRLAQQKAVAAVAKARAVKLDPMLLKNIQSATSLQGVTGPVVTGGKKIDPLSIRASMTQPATAIKPPATPVPTTPVSSAADDKLHPPHFPPGTVPPRPGTSGRGF